MGSEFEEKQYGLASEVVPAFVDKLLKARVTGDVASPVMYCINDLLLTSDNTLRKGGSRRLHRSAILLADGFGIRIE